MGACGGTANDKKKDKVEEDAEAKKRAEAHKKKVAEKKAALKKKHEDQAKAAAAKVAAQEEHSAMMGSHAAKQMSDDLKVLLIDMFARYDLDGSKKIDSKEELKQLVTNLVVKLEMGMSMKDVDALVEKQEGAEEGIDFDEEAFANWFVDPKNFDAADSIKGWVKSDMEPEDEKGAFAPFILGSYSGLLEDEEGNKFTTTYKEHERTTFRVDIQSPFFSANEAYYEDDFKFFDEKSEAYKWVLDQEEVKDGKVPLTARKGCDNIGYFTTSGWIKSDGTLHYERSYDIDQDASSKEPHFVLDGKVSEDGKTIEGTWEDKNDAEKISAENHPFKDMTVAQMREKCTKLKGAKGKFKIANDLA